MHLSAPVVVLQPNRRELVTESELLFDLNTVVSVMMLDRSHKAREKKQQQSKSMRQETFILKLQIMRVHFRNETTELHHIIQARSILLRDKFSAKERDDGFTKTCHFSNYSLQKKREKPPETYNLPFPAPPPHAIGNFVAK